MLTELLLDDLEDLFLVKFLWQTLYSRQSLATIALCRTRVSVGYLIDGEGWALKYSRTLDPNMDIILGLLSLASVFVGFGEGVCNHH